MKNLIILKRLQKTNQFKIEKLITFGELQLKQIATKDVQIG